MTATAGGWGEIVALIGARRRAEVDAGRCVASWVSDDGEPICEVDLEPLFVWYVAPPRLEWTTPRPALRRNVPVPADPGDVEELAFAMARTFAAIAPLCVARHENDEDWEPAIAHESYAIVAFRWLAREDNATRTTKLVAFVARQLDHESQRLIATVARFGSRAARPCSERVSDLARLVRTVTMLYADDLAIAERTRALATALDAWAIRAAIPTEEPLVVGAELGAEARRWS